MNDEPRKLNIIIPILLVHFKNKVIICKLGDSDFWIQQVQITKSTHVTKIYL